MISRVHALCYDIAPMFQVFHYRPGLIDEEGLSDDVEEGDDGHEKGESIDTDVKDSIPQLIHPNLLVPFHHSLSSWRVGGGGRPLFFWWRRNIELESFFGLHIRNEPQIHGKWLMVGGTRASKWTYVLNIMWTRHRVIYLREKHKKEEKSAYTSHRSLILHAWFSAWCLPSVSI